MADVHSQATRSFNMKMIKGKNTKPEIIVRKFLHKSGIRYRLHVKEMHGKPDLVLPKYKTVIFVNGCFWHKHDNCKYFKTPGSNTDWWMSKIERTVKKDQESYELLMQSGWKVLIVWECELKSVAREITLNKLLAKLKSQTK